MTYNLQKFKNVCTLKVTKLNFVMRVNFRISTPRAVPPSPTCVLKNPPCYNSFLSLPMGMYNKSKLGVMEHYFDQTWRGPPNINGPHHDEMKGCAIPQRMLSIIGRPRLVKSSFQVPPTPLRTTIPIMVTKIPSLFHH